MIISRFMETGRFGWRARIVRWVGVATLALGTSFFVGEAWGKDGISEALVLGFEASQKAVKSGVVCYNKQRKRAKAQKRKVKK